MTFLDLAEREPDAPALDDLTRSRTRTRGELIDRARRLATLFRHEWGLEPGDHLAQMMGNRVEFVEVALAALLSGLWLTPIGGRLSVDEVRYVLDDSAARLVLCDTDHRRVVSGAADQRRVVQVGRALDEAVAASDPLSVDLSATPGGNMFYTSGTTGRPKGVIRAAPGTLREALEALPRAGRALGLDGAGAHLVTGPLYHAAPLGFAVMDQHGGARVVLMGRFDPRLTLRLIESEHIATTHLVPTMFVRLLRLEAGDRAADLSSLRTVLHGAAPIAPDVKRAMIDWWGPVLVEYWGASEGGVVTLVDSGDWLSRPGTVGRPIGDHDVWAGDDQGRRLAVGEEGLLWCHRPGVSEVFRYHGDGDKTAAVQAGPGTYNLGDVGRVDEEGYVYLSDRRSNMIISGGVNIYPAEIEAVLGSHPAVADVAVFGVPDEEWGESVKAAIEPSPGVVWTDAVEADVVEEARRRLAGYKVPRTFDVHERLPREDTGKLATRVLRDPYWRGSGREI